MNAGLLLFGFLMIVSGAVAGFYPISILGVFLLIAGLLAPSRKVPARPQPTPTGQRPTTTTTTTTPSSLSRRPQTTPQHRPPQPMQPQPVPAQPTAPASMAQPAATTIPVLFPTTMFPFFSPITPTEPPQEQKQERKAESRDELVELAAIAVFLRLLSG